MCDIPRSINTKDSIKNNTMTKNKIMCAVSVNSNNGFSGTGIPGSHLCVVELCGQTATLWVVQCGGVILRWVAEGGKRVRE